MDFPKHTDEAKQAFRDLVEPLLGDAVQVKAMFGSLGAFVNGNMFAGLFGTDVGAKLDADSAEELRSLGGGPFGPAERPMGGYVSLPASFTAAESLEWLERARAYVSTLPPKTPKKK